MQAHAENALTHIDHMHAGANDQRVRFTDYTTILFCIGQRIQEMLHAIEPCPFLVVRLDDRPRCICRIGIEEHRLLCFHVVVPFIERFAVDWQ